MAYSPVPASDDLNKALDHLTGNISNDKADQVRELHADKDLQTNYTMCTWFGGCYWCKDPSTGKWVRIKCIA